MAALDAQFDEAKIAMGEIRSLRELGESEWADYWGAVQEVPDRSGGSFRLPGRPWKFASESLDPLGPPAFQGEHNAEVFGELGLSREDITAAHAAGAPVGGPREEAKAGVFRLRPSSEERRVGKQCVSTWRFWW